MMITRIWWDGPGIYFAVIGGNYVFWYRVTVDAIQMTFPTYPVASIDLARSIFDEVTIGE